MKIKITILLSGLLAAAAFSGCTAEGDMPSAQPLTAIRAVNAGLSGVSSRSQVGGIADDGSLVMQWSPGDRIGVFGASQSNVCFTSANETAADETTFSYTGTFSGTPSTAYYPYTEGAADVAAVPVNIPAVQTYSDVASVAAYDFKASSSAERQSDGSYRMRFRSMVTLLRLQIDLSAVSGLAADETLLSIGMTAGTGSLSGAFTCDLNNPDADLTPVDAAATLTVDMAGRPALSRQVTAYAVAAPGCTGGTKLDFVITTDRHVATFTAALLGTMEGGAFYDVPLNATVLANNGAVIKDVDEPDEPAEETANCYMITTAGEHSFYARQIGNGDKGIIPGAGFHVTSSKINPKSAKVLWQDTQGFIDEGSVRLADDGRVYYTATGNTGNALIAVYSGDGCTGDILWSWHIWGTGDTLPADEEVTNYNGAAFMMMDRPLGAHSATSYLATLYQWGRKDPIPNSLKYYVDGKETAIETTYPVYNVESSTIVTGIENPGALIRLSSQPENWLSTQNNLLWGDNNLKDAYTWKYPNYLDDASADETKGWTDVKTIYDPSPAGYRVASKFAWTGFVNNYRGTNASVSDNYRLDYVNYVKYDGGFWFKKNTTDAVGTFYPMVGSRGSADGSLWVGGNAPCCTLNYTAYYWSSAPQKNAHNAQCLSIGSYTAGSKATVVDALHFSYMTNAYSVRCVRDGSTSGSTGGNSYDSSYTDKGVGFGVE